MPKSKQQKETSIQSLIDGIKSAKTTVFANFQGVKVKDSEKLRRDCRAGNITVLATKKTLLRRALAEAGVPDIDTKVFSGGVAVYMGQDEISAPKAVANFAKTNELSAIFGGIFDGKFVDASAIKALAALPGKQELLGQLVGTLNAPISGFVNVLAGNLRGLVSVLNNISEAKAKV